MDQDSEHLKMLALFHYIVGGLAALFACFPIIHLVLGIAMLTGMQVVELPLPTSEAVLSMIWF